VTIGIEENRTGGDDGDHHAQNDTNHTRLRRWRLEGVARAAYVLNGGRGGQRDLEKVLLVQPMAMALEGHNS
jgi:hypothetical protein